MPPPRALPTVAPTRALTAWRALRALLARRGDPYAGANLQLTRRVGALMFGVTGAIAAALMPLAHPTDHIGEPGWVVASVAVGLLAAGGLRMWKPRDMRPEEGLVWCYVAVLAIVILAYLTGGRDSPYYSLLLLWAGYTGATHPPRRVAVFLVVLVAAGLAPMLYESANSTATAGFAVRVAVWALLTTLATIWMQSVRDQRIELMAGERQAKGEARIDPLTGLGNRRGFDEALGRHINLAQRSRAPLSIVVSDLDDFKSVNDRYGHLAGDQVLRAAAEAVARALRGHDESFRWGGDEFAVILPQTDLTGARVVCERVTREVSGLRRPDGRPMQIACGPAQLVQGMNGHDLVDAADLALMSRKRGPRPVSRARQAESE